MVDAGVPLRVMTSAALPVNAACSTPPVLVQLPSAARVMVSAELGDGVLGEGRLACAGIPPDPEHRLEVGPVLEPMPDVADRLRLQRRRREVDHRLSRCTVPITGCCAAHRLQAVNRYLMSCKSAGS